MLREPWVNVEQGCTCKSRYWSWNTRTRRVCRKISILTFILELVKHYFFKKYFISGLVTSIPTILYLYWCHCNSLTWDWNIKNNHTLRKMYTSQSMHHSLMWRGILVFPGPALINLKISFRSSLNMYVWVNCDFSAKDQDMHWSPRGLLLGHTMSGAELKAIITKVPWVRCPCFYCILYRDFKFTSL